MTGARPKGNRRDAFVTLSAQTRALYRATLIAGERARQRPRGEEVDARGTPFPVGGSAA
jgi:hypothetical protein